MSDILQRADVVLRQAAEHFWKMEAENAALKSEVAWLRRSLRTELEINHPLLSSETDVSGKGIGLIV